MITINSTEYWYIHIQITKEAMNSLNLSSILNVIKEHGTILVTGHFSNSIICILNTVHELVLDQQLRELPIKYDLHPFRLSLFEPKLLLPSVDTEKNKYFFIKLIPPRTTFINDMTPHENMIMERHFDYLKTLQNQDQLVVAGPCLDEGSYGIILLRNSSMKEVREILQHEPSVVAGIMTAQVYEFTLLEE